MQHQSWRRERARLSYANVAATLALVLAMSGGAAAAGYVITSIRQIKPSVAGGLMTHSYEVFNDNPGSITTGSETLAALSNLPKGSYALSAKVQVSASGPASSTSSAAVRCFLVAGHASDEADMGEGPGFPGTLATTLPMQVTHTFRTAGGTATLLCTQLSTAGSNITVAFHSAKLDAVRVGSELDRGGDQLKVGDDARPGERRFTSAGMRRR
jgi:hypothetical protein